MKIYNIVIENFNLIKSEIENNVIQLTFYLSNFSEKSSTLNVKILFFKKLTKITVSRLF